MKIIGIKCSKCGRKNELWPDDSFYGIANQCKNFQVVRGGDDLDLVLKCGHYGCGGEYVKHDIKDNGQCWSFGDCSKVEPADCK